MTEFFAAPMEVKALGDGSAGEFSGYGAVYMNTDLIGDRLLPGCFSQALAERKAAGRPLPMHFNHGLAELGGERAVGVWTKVDDREDGLYLEGKISGMGTDRGRLLYERLRDGAVSGLSIGFRTKSATYGRNPGEPRRTIKIAALGEVSIVDDPCNPQARVLAVKSAAAEAMEEFKARLAPGCPDFPSEREAERFLRDAGLPKSLAVALIAGHGWKNLCARDAAAGEANEAAAKAAAAMCAALDSISFPSL